MSLTPEEQEVADELRAILSAPGADAAYNAIPETVGGKILNADSARELSPRFRTVRDRTAFTVATYEPARDYVYDRYMRTVSASRRKRAVLLAGGAASGKSTSVKRAEGVAADVIFDSNCAQFDKACRMIDAAVKRQWVVFVFYMHRNFRAAVAGMIDRAIKDGRYIALTGGNGQDLASLHFNAQRTFVQLAERYSDTENVEIDALRNPWTPDNHEDPTGISVKTLAPGGKRHYTSVEELYAIQCQVVQATLLEGKLPDHLRAALGLA